jgi:hypothetical protein
MPLRFFFWPWHRNVRGKLFANIYGLVAVRRAQFQMDYFVREQTFEVNNPWKN